VEYDNPAGSLGGANDARAVDQPPTDRVAHCSTRSAHCNREHLVAPRKAPSASRARVKGVHVRLLDYGTISYPTAPVVGAMTNVGKGA
jgi:hypothetical protein